MIESGTLIGPYRIVTLEGSREWAKFIAPQTHVVNRDVAFKVLSKRLVGDPEAIARFEKESKATAQKGSRSIASLTKATLGCYLNISAPFTISEALDGYSRYIVHHEIR